MSTTKSQNLLNDLTQSSKILEVLGWLSLINVWQDLEREAAKQLKPSGHWFLSGEEYQSWARPQASLLWVHGPAGSGKTVLSTNIIKHIQLCLGSNDGLAFFHCDRGNDKKTSCLAVLSSLLAQLCNQRDDIPPPILRAFNAAKRLGRGCISPTDAPLELLRTSIAYFDHLYIVIDGIDESKEMSNILDQLCNLVAGGNRSSVLVLSRDIPLLRSRMSCFPSVELNAANTKADLDEYVLAATAELYQGSLVTESVAKISAFLSANAQGVFLWAHLMISKLQAAITPSEISNILENPPIGLEAVFEESLQKLCKQTLNRQRLARKAFLWTLCSYRPLTWAELQCALAVDIYMETFEETKKPFLSAVLELCSPILQYQGKTSFLRPIHASVYDYFLDTGCCRTLGVPNSFISKPASHRQLALECLTTLSIAWRSENADGESPISPLVKYACLYWPDHLLSSHCDAEVMDRLITFLSSNYRRRWIIHFLFWQRDAFMLQKLFLTQKRILEWMPNETQSELPNYLDWAFDIPTILLKGFEDSAQQVETGICQTDIRNPNFGVSYFERLMVVRDLSRQFTQTGRLERAVHVFKNALIEHCKATDEPDHERLWILNTLGILYDQQGLTELSAQSQELALSLQTAALGPDHIETSWTKNELGRVYRHQGRYEEAERMHLDALSILTSVSADPDRDLEIAWTLSTLGRVHRKRGQFDLAITNLAKAYHIRTESLGEPHPHCLWILGDIGQCHYESGQLDLGIEFHRRALAGREKVLGSDHPDTCWTMNNLGVALAAKGLGFREEARAMQEKALQGQESILGKDHPHTVWTNEILARWH